MNSEIKISFKLSRPDIEYIRNATYGGDAELRHNLICLCTSVLFFVAAMFITEDKVLSLAANLIGTILLSLGFNIGFGNKSFKNALVVFGIITAMLSLLFVVSDVSLIMTYDHSKDTTLEILTGILAGCFIKFLTFPLAVYMHPVD